MLLRFFVLAALALATAPLASAQTAAERAVAYLERNAPRHSLTAADVAGVVVTDQSTSRLSGATHVYLRQQIGGVEVASGGMSVTVDRHGRVAHAAGRLVPGLMLKARPAAPSLTAADAAAALARDAGLVPLEPFVVLAHKGSPDAAVTLSDGGLTQEPVPARLVYVEEHEGGALRLAWETMLYLKDSQHAWFGYVDAHTGRVLARHNHVLHCFEGPQGHTHALAPAEGTGAPAAARAAQPLVPFASAHLAGLAEAFHGLGADGARYRVYAAPAESPAHALPAPPADARVLVVNPAHPVASPFGWHDTDGAPGPEHTRTRGNNVHAYTDTNASNSPDPDSDPDGTATLTFDFPLDLTLAPATYRPAAVVNLFYWNNLIHDIAYQYGFDEQSGNFQVNNYGRGGLGGDDVRAEAQDGSGTNNANFMTPPDGQRPRMQMYVGTTPTPAVDGDFDNAVITHEYAHGITIRLTGGASNTSCLNNAEQMGEGWSDWYGLMLTMRPSDTRSLARGVGTYLFGQPTTGPGIRPARYATDFAVNDWTYGHTRPVSAGGRGPSTPHGVGFVWATVLWELTWDLIEAYGFSADLYDASGTAGNQIALALVTEALKMQPCAPGFVSGRNAILAADEVLYDGAHTELLWRAFARRGLGIGASEGATSTNADNTESFAEPETIPPAAITDLEAIPNGDYVTLAFTATGDDGTVGTAAVYEVRYAATPIETPEDWAAATRYTGALPAPRASGTAEQLVVEGLAFETTYHFAVVATDESFNASPLSNSAEATTLAPPQLQMATAPIRVQVPLGGTATVPVAIGNTGASDLRFGIGLAETTGAPLRLRGPAGEAPAAGSRPADAPEGDKDAPEGDKNAPEGDKNAPEAPRTAALRAEGGPDAFGYRWIDSDSPGGPVYAWEDIRATGTPVTLGDDASTRVALPFPFPFYGVDKNDVAISSNGFLSFGTAGLTAFTNGRIPSTTGPNDAVYGFWDDLHPGVAGYGSQVHYLATPERFVVQYTNVPRYADRLTTGLGNTFQIVLRRSGQIEVFYETLRAPVLNSATVGIENASGTDGLEVVFDAPYLASNKALRFSALWVEATPSAGTVAAGGSETVTLAFDAGGLEAGTYTAEMTVATNEPGGAPRVVALEFVVGGTVSAEGGGAAFAGTHVLSDAHPNPAHGATRLTLEVAEAQRVRVALYDALGRRVATLFEGDVPARAPLTLEVDAARLAAGTYVVRSEGEHFRDARRLTVAR
ncbi:MAG: M36 family metallopeptidase [Rubricoccaceae bacterium]